jgi:hypothetical protein
VQNLKTFIETVKLPIEVFKELKEMIAHFAFIMTVFKKYEETLVVCGIASNEKLKVVGWLLYILARAMLLKGRNEIVESACLLIVVLVALIVNRPDLLKTLEHSQKLDEMEAKRKVCEVFKLHSFEAVDVLIEPFLRFLQQFTSTGNTKEPELEDYATFFAAEHLDFVIKRLNEVYQKHLPLDGIDERCFIGNDVNVITPARLTPFSRQGIANISLTPKRAKWEDTSQMLK